MSHKWLLWCTPNHFNVFQLKQVIKRVNRGTSQLVFREGSIERSRVRLPATANIFTKLNSYINLSKRSELHIGPASEGILSPENKKWEKMKILMASILLASITSKWFCFHPNHQSPIPDVWVSSSVWPDWANIFKKIRAIFLLKSSPNVNNVYWVILKTSLFK